MSKEKEIRYFIEHQLVRKWFFEEGKQFTGTLAEHNEIFPRMVRQIFYENGCEYLYTDDQFTVAALHLEGDIYCISIGMPEPEYELPLEGSGDTAVYVLARISGEGNRAA